PPAVHKSEIATEDTPQKGRKSPIGWIVGIVALLLIVIAVVLALNSSKGDDDKAQSNGDDTTSSEDVLLSYSREYLTIYNSSNQTLNLSGIQLMLPNHDANRTFDTYYIGVNTISNFGPKSCIHITFDQTANPNNAVNPPAPDYCEPDNIAYREYQTRGQKSYY